jgi:hypothetical protein
MKKLIVVGLALISTLCFAGNGKVGSGSGDGELVMSVDQAQSSDCGLLKGYRIALLTLDPMYVETYSSVSIWAVISTRTMQAIELVDHSKEVADEIQNPSTQRSFQAIIRNFRSMTPEIAGVVAQIERAAIMKQQQKNLSLLQTSIKDLIDSTCSSN